MIVVGLTGSIGSGKSTAASMLRSISIPVHEADAAVHSLLLPGAAGHEGILAAFPPARYPEIYEKIDGLGTPVVSRPALADLIFSQDAHRLTLEAILHPLVRKAQKEFLILQQKNAAKIVVLDIPLLFETGAQERVDYTINLSAPFCLQRERVLMRPGMTEKKFEAILRRQMPDAEKCALADFVVSTAPPPEETMRDLNKILEHIRESGRK